MRLSREYTDPASAGFLLMAAVGGAPRRVSYREVLLRKKIRVLHGLSERDVDALLTAIAANAIVREPEAQTGAPDAKDDHLWSLVQGEANSVLVTGDHALEQRPPPKSAVLQPREFVDSLPD